MSFNKYQAEKKMCFYQEGLSLDRNMNLNSIIIAPER